MPNGRQLALHSTHQSQLLLLTPSVLTAQWHHVIQCWRCWHLHCPLGLWGRPAIAGIRDPSVLLQQHLLAPPA